MLFEKDISETPLSRDLREALTNAARPMRLAPGETLFTEQDEGDAIYFVLDGRMEISMIADDGRKIGLDVLSRGAFFGEIALLDPGPRTATAMALEACSLLMLNRAGLHYVLDRNPLLVAEVMQLIGKRMRYITDQLNEQILLPLPKRLARKLLRLATFTDCGTRCLRLSHSELADLVGASREAVSKALSAWNKQGLLQTGRGSIELLDEEALRDIAGL
ncbi:MAG: Crp/Fnr family transcriptional regulator [Pseudomonadota bacterium]